MLPPFDLARPRRLEEALALVAEGYQPYCGGTELLTAMKLGLLEPSVLVDLKGLPQLSGVAARGDELVVGAATTHTELATDELVARRLPLLRRVERRVGNARVRSQGSIGGNLCFAEPRSDVTTVLGALGARVVLVGATGRRELAVTGFLLGSYETALEPGELLVEVVIPGLDHAAGVHLKLQHSERPVVSVVLVRERADGSCALAVGAAGDVPHVLVVGSPGEIDPADVASAVDPVADLAGSAEYKRHLTEVLVRRALVAEVEQAA